MNRVLAEAAGALIAARILVPVFSLRRVQNRIQVRQSPPGDLSDALMVTRAVALAAVWIPGTRCLPQAIASQWMLARRGCPSRLRIGVRQDGNGSVTAHAWLEARGQVVIGGSTQLDSFTALTAFDAA